MEVSVDLHLARAIFLKMDKSRELVDVQHSCASGDLCVPSCVWLICNSNWTEWSTIQGVIGRVISKSAEREARGRFEITSTITT